MFVVFSDDESRQPSPKSEEEEGGPEGGQPAQVEELDVEVGHAPTEMDKRNIFIAIDQEMSERV